jgi:hypothetical protein
MRYKRSNEITSEGGWRILFAFVAQWPAAIAHVGVSPK